MGKLLKKRRLEKKFKATEKPRFAVEDLRDKVYNLDRDDYNLPKVIFNPKYDYKKDRKAHITETVNPTVTPTYDKTAQVEQKLVTESESPNGNFYITPKKDEYTIDDLSLNNEILIYPGVHDIVKGVPGLDPAYKIVPKAPSKPPVEKVSVAKPTKPAKAVDVEDLSAEELESNRRLQEAEEILSKDLEKIKDIKGIQNKFGSLVAATVWESRYGNDADKFKEAKNILLSTKSRQNKYEFSDEIKTYEDLKKALYMREDIGADAHPSTFIDENIFFSNNLKPVKTGDRRGWTYKVHVQDFGEGVRPDHIMQNQEIVTDSKGNPVYKTVSRIKLDDKGNYIKNSKGQYIIETEKVPRTLVFKDQVHEDYTTNPWADESENAIGIIPNNKFFYPGSVKEGLEKYNIETTNIGGVNQALPKDIIYVTLPEFYNIDGKPRKFKMHKNVARKFKQMFEAWADLGVHLDEPYKDKGVMQFPVSTFYPRNIRGGNTPSTHSYGTAVDINSTKNHYHQHIPVRRTAPNNTKDKWRYYYLIDGKDNLAWYNPNGKIIGYVGNIPIYDRTAKRYENWQDDWRNGIFRDRFSPAVLAANRLGFSWGGRYADDPHFSILGGN